MPSPSRPPLASGATSSYESASSREAIRAAGLELGFLQVGFAPAEPPRHADAYLRWLDEGRHGEMAWMARPDSMRRRIDPREALTGCRTIVVCSLGYGSPERAADGASGGAVDAEGHAPATALVARYARDRDYHLVFEEKLGTLAAEIRGRFPDADTRPYVDYGPVLERDHAQRAGLGWIGKNTMLIHPALGSWLLLGEILTTADIPPDHAFEADRCGTCERCVEACPTGAITGPRQLDARLCISYLTIELRGSIPEHLRPAIGTRVFGCDICQEVCPWNDGTAPLEEPTAGRPLASPSMIAWAEEVLDMSEDEFRGRYRESALGRPGRDGTLRNLCVGLGNCGYAEAVPVLMRCLLEPSPIVREHAAWALGRLDELRAAPG